jgi:serine/threonine protein kinase
MTLDRSGLETPIPIDDNWIAIPEVVEEDERPAPAELATRPRESPYVGRTRGYAFAVDDDGQPIELGSGRFAKAYLGEERWAESKTAYRRSVAIKILQRGVSQEDQFRFQIEKEILERVQGHPNIVEVLASGESEADAFIPPPLRAVVENDFLVLELMEMSLEERLKGARGVGQRDDLLAVPPRERVFRALDYLVPVATAIEYSHIVCDTSHRDIKPANILLRLPDPNLWGSQLVVKLADFNVGKGNWEDSDLSMTKVQSVPGTLFFQSPEQEMNLLELLVNVEQGSPEITFFEDFYTDIYRNDTFCLFNRNEQYKIIGTDRARKRIILDQPFAERTQQHVRAKVIKAVGRPADIYSLGAVLYYLISGAYANPKSLYDAFRKFIEYDGDGPANTVEAYIDHEYGIIGNLRAPKNEEGDVQVAPEDRFFSYKHYLDGNGELIDIEVMRIIARAMIRNKPDSYCASWDLHTEGICQLVQNLIGLYMHYGVDPRARAAHQSGKHATTRRRRSRTVWNMLTRRS